MKKKNTEPRRPAVDLGELQREHSLAVRNLANALWRLENAEQLSDKARARHTEARNKLHEATRTVLQ